MSTSTHNHNHDDDIPFDIQTEIMKRIADVKSLIRYRCVSKPWKSLIDSSKFIADHYKSNTSNKNNHHYILVRYKKEGYNHLVSVVDGDDDCFPQHNLPVTIPYYTATSFRFDNGREPILIGTSHGLLCFLYGGEHMFGMAKELADMVVICNPSIRKSVTIHVPHMHHLAVVNFGVCRRTRDPKLVNITLAEKLADIYTLSCSSGAWTSLSINLPNNISQDISFFIFSEEEWGRHKTAIDGILYWHATTYNSDDNVWYNRIITFDLTSEEFGDVCLPDSLATAIPLSITKLSESFLVLLEYHTEGPYQLCHVWMMMMMEEEHGACSKVFKKLFTIEQPPFYMVKGFSMNGQPIIETEEENLKYENILQVYDPSTSQIIDHDLNHLMIARSEFVYGCYTETLLLLHQSDSMTHS